MGADKGTGNGKGGTGKGGEGAGCVFSVGVDGWM